MDPMNPVFAYRQGRKTGFILGILLGLLSGFAFDTLIDYLLRN